MCDRTMLGSKEGGYQHCDQFVTSVSSYLLHACYTLIKKLLYFLTYRLIRSIGVEYKSPGIEFASLFVLNIDLKVKYKYSLARKHIRAI